MRIVFHVLVVAFLVTGGTLCQADVVVWSSTAYTVNGSFGQNLDTGIFDQSGTLILANNTGGDALTFDGINFAAGTNVFSGTYGGFHESGGSQNTDLARFGTHGNSGPDMVTLSGLTIGNGYRIQVLVYDGRGDAGIVGRTIEADGVNMGQYANGITNVTWGDGLLLTGTFTAGATTKSFTLEAFDGTTSKGGQMNALFLHQTSAIPEPSSLLLCSFVGLGCLIRRRR